MAELLSVVGILANLAAVGAAGVQISKSLYKISKRLINAPKEIAEVAWEITSLSDMVEVLGDVLKNAEKLLKPQLLQNAKDILTRFEEIQKDIKDIIKRGAHGFERLRLAFGWTTLSQLLGKLNALKSSLSLIINMSQLSIVAKRASKKPRNRKSSNLERSAQSRFRNLAETYVEANREAIRNLRSQAVNKPDEINSSSKSKDDRETNVFVHWSESPDAVAAWLYFMIFDPNHETIQTKHRNKQKKSYAKTVKSQQPNAAASDSDQPEPSSSLKSRIGSDPIQLPKTLTDDQESELYASVDPHQTVNSLLGVWTNLNEHQIYEPPSAAELQENEGLGKTVDSVIRRCLNECRNEGEFSHRKDEPLISSKERLRNELKQSRVVSSTPPPSVPMPPSLAPTPRIDEPSRKEMIATYTQDIKETADSNKQTSAAGKDHKSGSALSSAEVEAAKVSIVWTDTEKLFEERKAKAESQAAKAYEQSLAEKGKTPQYLYPVSRAKLQAAKAYQEAVQKHSDNEAVKKQMTFGANEKGRTKYFSEADNCTLYTISTTAGSSIKAVVASSSNDKQNVQPLRRIASTDGKIHGYEGHGGTDVGIGENVPRPSPLDTAPAEDNADDKDEDNDMTEYINLDELKPEDIISKRNTSQSRIPDQQKTLNKPPNRQSLPANPSESMMHTAYANGNPATGSRTSAREPRSTHLLDPSLPQGSSYLDPSLWLDDDNPFSPFFHSRERLNTSSAAQPANLYYNPWSSAPASLRPGASAPTTFTSGEPSYTGSSNPFAEPPFFLPPPYRRGYLQPPPKDPEVLKLERRVAEAEAARITAESHARLKSEEADRALLKAETEERRRIAELDATRKHFEEEQVRNRRSQQLVELENLIKRQDEERRIKEQAFEDGKRDLAKEAAEKQNIAVLNAQRDAEQRAEKERKELSEKYEKQLSAAREEAKEVKRQVEEARRKLYAAQDELEQRNREASQPKTEVNPWLYMYDQSRPPSRANEDTDDDDDEDNDEDESTEQQTETTIDENNPSKQEQQTIIKFPARLGWGDAEKAELYASLKHFDILPMFEDRLEFSISQRDYYQVPGSGGCEMRGTMFWHPSLSPTESDLYVSLKAVGFRPIYLRTTEFGQTWYWGCQPVHVYFFKPCYGPQIPPRYPRQAQGLFHNEQLIISKDYVNVDALDLSGFRYQILPSGEVLLDPSMDAQDIENVVRTSFFIKEARLRKQFRSHRTIRGLNLGQGNAVEVSSSETDSLRSANGKPSRSSRLSRWLSNATRSSSQTFVMPTG